MTSSRATTPSRRARSPNLDGEWRVAFLKDQAPDVEFGTAPFPVPDDQVDRYGAGYVTGNIIGHLQGLEEPRGGLGAHQVPHPDTGAIVKLANGIKNVPTTTAALASPDLQVDDAFKTFLDMFENPASQTSPSTANGAATRTSSTTSSSSGSGARSDDLDAGLAKTDEEIDKALQLGQAP